MTAPSTASPTDEPQLGLWDCISIIVGIVIGTTIFELPWLIFASVPNPWMGLGVWVFGGLLALIGGLCYAELATTYPRSGGDYVYLTNAFGSWVGFLFGWAQLAVILPASIGVMTFVFANFAANLMPVTTINEMGLRTEYLHAGVAGIAVILLTLVNVIGVTFGKVTQNVLTAAKVIGLTAILVSGFVWGEYRPADWQFPTTAQGLGWGSLAIILVLYAYGGWNDAAFVAAEVRNRRRNIPLALILGIGAITLIYVLINAAYIFGLGFSLASRPGRLPALLLEKPLGQLGAVAISIIVMTSALGAANGLIFTGARVYATLGADHRLFGWLGRWKPGGRPPVPALLLQSTITIAMLVALTTQQGHDSINSVLMQLSDYLPFQMEVSTEWKADKGFETLVSHSAPAFWLFFLLTGFSLFVLRDKNPHVQRPFSVPFFPLLPIIFCNMCVYMLYQSTIYVGWRVLFAVFLLIAGLPLYAISRMLGTPPRQPTLYNDTDAVRTEA